ncbi:MAG: hypothetical protein ACI9MU_002430 [Alphaproteobacteria bacterium]|jgi:hypothetical protein
MKKNFRPATTLFGLALAMCSVAPPAGAHAFGTRYDLPLPLELYLAAAGAAVALSFVIMALAFDRRSARARIAWIDLTRYAPMRILAHPVVVTILQTISVGLFLLVIIAGFFGNQDPIKNFAPAFVWIIWWVGLAYVAALAGNIWPTLNPWSNILGAVERLLGFCGLRRALSLDLPYPRWLGVWPAIVLFMLFAWFELITGAAKIPANLAISILIYSGITWLGMLIFGRSVWLAHCEAFSLAFGVFGRFAPIGARAEDDAGVEPHRWGLRPWASGLITTTPCRLSMTIFILVLLSTVTFDGFKETPFWSDMLQAIALAPFFHPLIRLIHDLGFNYFTVLDTIVLVLFPVLFVLVYLAFSWMTRWAAASDQSVTQIAGLFIYSLVPIAIAYHLAHYLSYLLTGGQLIIPLSSDPLGIGWNIFGTAGYKIEIGVVGAQFVWYTAVIAIVAGHVFAVGVSHFVALKVFESARIALRSQYPLLVLMVGYTMVSLWILSQPIVGSPSLSTLSARSDSVSIAPFEFRELCVALRSKEKIKVEFQSGQPIEYDIHYHDGLTVRFPVRLTDVTSHADQFVAQSKRAYCLMWFNRSLKDTTLNYRVTGPEKPTGRGHTGK